MDRAEQQIAKPPYRVSQPRARECYALMLLDRNAAEDRAKARGLLTEALAMMSLEQHDLPYIVVAKLTMWVKRAAQRVEAWTVLDEHYCVGEFRLKLYGWSVERRFVAIREEIRETRASVGRKLIDVPGYTFRLFVTSCTAEPAEIWRDYNRRADMENRIAELKHDLGAHGFCLKRFPTEAAFRSVLLLFNLLAEFQRAAGLQSYRQPARIRTQVLTCGAILGRAGRRLVVHLSQSWGGLQKSKCDQGVKKIARAARMQARAAPGCAPAVAIL